MNLLSMTKGSVSALANGAGHIMVAPLLPPLLLPELPLLPDPPLLPEELLLEPPPELLPELPPELPVAPASSELDAELAHALHTTSGKKMQTIRV
jgi:hypothetical protein